MIIGDAERETLSWLNYRGGGNPFGFNEKAACALYRAGLIETWRAGWWTLTAAGVAAL